MQTIVKWIDILNHRAGQLAGWSSFVLVLLISIDVAMRYLFGFTMIWIIEVEIYLFAIIFLLGSGYALQKDRHVRVDVIYDRMSDFWKAWIDLIGGIFFLLPWSFIISWVGYQYAYMSYVIGERSPQPGGLPALYLLKGLMALGFFLLFLQGCSQIYSSIQRIRKH